MKIADDLQEREASGGRFARTGLVLLNFWLLEMSRPASDVVGIRIRRGDLAPLVVRRRAGETLAELEERANPGRSWRAFPWPLFDEADHILTPDEWEEALRLHAMLEEISSAAEAQALALSLDCAGSA